MLLLLADRQELLVSGGSDFHGPNFSNRNHCGVDMDTRRWKSFRDSLSLFEGREETPQDDPAAKKPVSFSYRRFLLRVLFPALLAIGLFVASIFLLFLPAVERSLLERKRETIQELTNTAWSILASYQKDVEQGHLTLEQAQDHAIRRIRFLRYGQEGKDYFWITDLHPHMIMHPYRSDLEGEDLRDFHGKDDQNPFVQFVNVVGQQDAGYVDYYWQWKDDPDRVEPKESYVRGFAPWDWVIGTGLYMDDVHAELAAITGRLVDISFEIIVVVGVLLFYIAFSSLRIEQRRQKAERDLVDSHQKYRALAQASREGTLLLQDGKCAFANQTLQTMLGYSPAELSMLDGEDLFEAVETPVRHATALRKLLEGDAPPAQFEARMIRKDGGRVDALLSPSAVEMGGREGYIVVARDIGRSKQMEAELGLSRSRFQALTRNLPLGVFRVEAREDGQVLEANAAACALFGIADPGRISEWTLEDVFGERGRAGAFLRNVRETGEVRNFTFQARRRDGAAPTLSVAASLVGDADSAYCDCVVEDVTALRRRESEQEKLLSELQTSLLFLNEPVRHCMREVVTCGLEDSIADVARKMTEADYSAAVVLSESGAVVGFISDHDMRSRVVAAERRGDGPAREIMTAPVAEIEETALVYEAFLRMREKGHRHLVVRDAQGRVAGVLRNKELARFDAYSPAVLVMEIQRGSTVSDVARGGRRLAGLVRALVDSGAAPAHVCRTIGGVFDALTERFIDLAISRLGPAPRPFVWLALGSGGRNDMTLSSDQDNALLYANEGEGTDEEAEEYFLRLGGLVCQWLDEAGFDFCPGNMMAQNPRWCRPLRDWKRYFGDWIRKPEAEELLRFNIFFDFRGQFGELSLERELRVFIESVLQKEAPFYLHLARNALEFKAPLGLFGQLRGGVSGKLNLKEALAAVVHFARLYALREGQETTDTLGRLAALGEEERQGGDIWRELSAAYDRLMDLRLRHQASCVGRGARVDDILFLEELSQVDISMLKQGLQQVVLAQKKINFDFLGGTG